MPRVPRSTPPSKAATPSKKGATPQPSLAKNLRILDLVAEKLTNAGVVGPMRAAKLIYLVLITRLLARPVSIALKGPSAAGKSFILEAVLKLFPTSAYYALSAMSEHALAYSHEPLRHRFLVLYEAAGLGGPFAQYILRSLLSEGRLVYETVESSEKGLRPKKIEREGPSGLIVTTTRVALHPENETRLLSLTIDDSPDLTLAVLTALGQGQLTLGKTPDFADWHRLQVWLEKGEHRVFVPFAAKLFSAIPPVSVRLRRDAPAVLSLVVAHAILHRASRQRDASGAIVAELQDYKEVYDLVHDLVAEGAQRSIPPTVRETVGAVTKMVTAGASEVHITAVAEQLGLDKSSASRRVHAAIRLGYLINLESRRRPARLVQGEPLPADVEILPAPETLA
jgi:hypothetical protein